MSRRLFIVLAVLLCALGALLLLSTLFVTPEAQPDAAAAPPVAHAVSTFIAMPPVQTSAATASLSEWLRVSALFAVLMLLLPRLNCTCDANGRVLCSRRYVRSFYPVFKQNLACG